MFVGVAFVVTTMFLGVTYERERADYISLCPDEFVKAWNAWDQSDPTKMPPLPKKSCLLASRGHVYVCSEEEGGCSLITHNLGPQGVDRPEAASIRRAG